VCHVEIDLSLKVAQVFSASLMVFGDDFVAGTVITKRLTKWNVHIK
jgi:hypothetical protein